MDYIIRKMKETEYSLLKEVLYEAVFIPDGCKPLEKSVVSLPELSVYIENFGNKKDDICSVAELNGKIIGAVWTQIMKDYGHIDDEIPSLAMSLYKEYRNVGIGQLC